MEYFRRISALTSLLVPAAALAIVPLRAQQIIHHPKNSDPLEAKWDCAWKEVASRKLSDGFWVGYGIQRWMGEHSFIGSFGDHSGYRDVSLHELLYGQKESLILSDEEASVRREAERDLEKRSGRKYAERKVLKGVAILFCYDSGQGEPMQPRRIVVCNLSTSVDRQVRPLLWLGSSRDDESVVFLERMFGDTHSDKMKESLVFAISLHDSSDQALKFVRDVLAGSESEKVRGSAAFFLSERDHEVDIPLMVKVATHDPSQRVRDQAVFGLSRMESDAAVEALIDLARHAERKDVREKAIFWVSQNASDRVVGTLKDIAFNDDETGVQRQALFALSRLKNADGVKELIEIAKCHRNPQIRREAMFWLGRSDDPRAFDFLVEMVRRK
jgi:hypothetical protein